MNMVAVLTWRAAVIARWVALVAGSLFFLMFLAFFFGEGPPNFFHLTGAEKISFVAMLLLFLGLPAAWKWEGGAGLASLCGFGLLIAFDRHHLQMSALDLPAMIGALHLLCWSRLHAGPPAGITAFRLSRNWILAVAGSLLVFVLLCANEMFGEPPLMTPALRPGPGLAATWRCEPAGLQLSIETDASVAGHYGDLPVSGTILNNRSWFGRLLHWRDDYRINGHVGDQTLVIRLSQRRRNLEGWLWQIPYSAGRNTRITPLRLTLRKD